MGYPTDARVHGSPYAVVVSERTSPVCDGVGKWKQDHAFTVNLAPDYAVHAAALIDLLAKVLLDIVLNVGKNLRAVDRIGG